MTDIALVSAFARKRCPSALLSGGVLDSDDDGSWVDETEHTVTGLVRDM